MAAAHGQRKAGLEREGVIASIGRALSGARAGSGRALFLVGEAGLGKTTMLQVAAGLADGFRIGIARADPIEAGVPFGIVSQLYGDVGLETRLAPAALRGPMLAAWPSTARCEC